MGYCRICCQPSPWCCCGDDYQFAPMETWSQMMARMPGQGVAASIGGPTTPGTATTKVQEQGVPPPPPGLHPPDFTNWSLPLMEAPVTGGLPMPSGGPPGIVHDVFLQLCLGLFIGFLVSYFAMPDVCAGWGNCCERLREFFVRVLHSSRVNLIM